MLKRCQISALVFVSLAVPCAAQGPGVEITEIPKQVRAASAQCSQGVVYDTGSFTDGYIIGSGNPDDATMVMKFDLPTGTTRLDQVCGCFTRKNTTGPSSMSFEAVVFNDDGPGGQPGTFLGSVTATASAIPISAAQFYSINFSGSGIVLPDTSVYVGFRWPGGNIALCGDATASTPLHASYGSANGGSSWLNTQAMFSGNPPRVLGVRLDPTPTATTCTPSATAICLNNNRFRVEATFDTTDDQSGQAQAVKLTDETGYLWFFSSSNIEVVVKALNACSYNNRYWVYSAGLTDVHVVLTVTDTETGAFKTYTNPQGRAFLPILDSSAFNTCP
ncbi:MAG TPA: hypothetical protein VGS07_25075 [Thermoanaerobaculia bacterium]|jgi:hypothetical protein|nr:hypothetical protein [Thermoanaerobaculia bacterium]